MARLPAPDPALVTDEEREIFRRWSERIGTSYGDSTVTNIRGWADIVLHCPPVADISLRWRDANRSALSPYYRNVGLVLAGVESRNLRLFSDHIGDAIESGLRIEAALAILDGDEAALTEPEHELVQYAREFMAGALTDQTFEALHTRLGSRELVGFTYLVGLTSVAGLMMLAFGLEVPTHAEMRTRVEAIGAALELGADLGSWRATSPAEPAR